MRLVHSLALVLITACGARATKALYAPYSPAPGHPAQAIAAERPYKDLIELLSTLGAGLPSESARRLLENAERHGWTDVVELLRRIPAKPERSR